MQAKTKKIKTPKQLERHFKGVANHWRIEILQLIAEHRNITVEEIAEELNCNFKTASGHIHRLVQSGLVNKKYHGLFVCHTLSPYGEKFYKFIKLFSYSRE
jgi:predicted transcriptional regulator